MESLNKKVEYMVFAQMNRDYLKEEYMKAVKQSNMQNMEVGMAANAVMTSGSIETVKQSNMQNMEVGMAANAVMASGSIEAAEQFAQLLISRTRAVAETKRLQAANAQLLIENTKLKEAVCDAYNEGYQKVDVKLATCTDMILIRR